MNKFNDAIADFDSVNKEVHKILANFLTKLIGIAEDVRDKKAISKLAKIVAEITKENDGKVTVLLESLKNAGLR